MKTLEINNNLLDNVAITRILDQYAFNNNLGDAKGFLLSIIKTNDKATVSKDLKACELNLDAFYSFMQKYANQNKTSVEILVRTVFEPIF